MEITYNRHWVDWDDTLDNAFQAQPLNVRAGDEFVVLEQRDGLTKHLVEIYVERDAVEDLIAALRRAV